MFFFKKIVLLKVSHLFIFLPPFNGILTYDSFLKNLPLGDIKN